jgi:drug/metabolite transporter (DMT)-like permease
VSTLAILAVFNGQLRSIDVIGIVITVSGVLVVSGIFNSRRSEKRLTPGVLYGLATLFLWGIAYALLGQAVVSIGWQKSVLIDITSGMLALFSVFALTSIHELKGLLSNSYFKDKFIIGTAVLQLSGGVIFSIGLAHTHSTAIMTTISSCYPSITIYLALKHFDERKRLILVLGSLITIIGVIVLTF